MLNIKNHITKSSFYVVLLSIFILNFGMATFAQEKDKVKKKKKSDHFELKISLAGTYDDNILKYSDQYLERFMNGEDPGRFHIDTYDDFILTPGIGLSYTFKIFKKRKTKINADFKTSYYVVNQIKNWSYFTIGLQQYFSKRGSFKILYSYIPEFYVRHFRDREWIAVYGYKPITFQPYSFSKDNFGGYIQNTFFESTRLRFTFFYSKYYHNKHYTEFDSKNFTYSFRLYQKLHKKFRIEAAYTYITSNAKGYDASWQTPETSRGPDASYVEDIFNLGFIWYFPKIKGHRNNLDVDFIFQKRYYSSEYHPLTDPLHAGRVDNNYRVYATYNFYLMKQLKLSIFYQWLYRDSNTMAPINETFVSNEKDYRQNRLGFKLEYKLKF